MIYSNFNSFRSILIAFVNEFKGMLKKQKTYYLCNDLFEYLPLFSIFPIIPIILFVVHLLFKIDTKSIILPLLYIFLVLLIFFISYIFLKKILPAMHKSIIYENEDKVIWLLIKYDIKEIKGLKLFFSLISDELINQLNSKKWINTIISVVAFFYAISIPIVMQDNYVLGFQIYYYPLLFIIMYLFYFPVLFPNRDLWLNRRYYLMREIKYFLENLILEHDEDSTNLIEKMNRVYERVNENKA